MRFKVQTKLTFLVFLFMLLFLGGLLIMRRAQIKIEEAMLRNEASETGQFFDQIISLHGTSFKAFVTDYSFWDEMVRFLKTRDLRWAAENIDSGLSTFKANAVWIYHPDFAPVYATNNLSASDLKDLPIPKTAYPTLFAQSRFCHFFAQTTQGLMEIYGATIHPSSDSERKTTPRGYLFTGRLWTADFVTGLSKLTEADLKVGPPPPVKTEKTPRSVIEWNRPLLDWQGQPLTYLLAEKKRPAIDWINTVSQRQFFLYFVTQLLLLAVFFYCLLRWVGRPLASISQTLAAEDLAPIEALRQDETEFGHIAKLINNFFSQKTALQDSYRRLQALERLRDDLTHMIVHDMRTPLTVVSGALELLAIDSAGKKIDPDITRLLGRARNQSERVNEMVKQLLDISRMEAGQMPIDKTEQNLTETARSALNAVASLAEDRTLRLTHPKTVRAFYDGDIIRRVLVNLLGNALKFTPVNGEIKVSVESDGSDARVAVTDNGYGIPPEKHAEIFEKFGQVQNEKTRLGSGLGLTFCKMAVEAHGGHIGVESEPGKGSTFWFTLPQAKS